MQFRSYLKKLTEPFLRPHSAAAMQLQQTNQQNTEQVIKGLKVFSKLNAKQIKKLARLFICRTYSKGELLIKKGDTGLGMFVLVSGRAEVFDEHDGVRTTLSTMEVGACIGEMSLI